MRKVLLISFILILLLIVSYAYAGSNIEVFRIRILNDYMGPIDISIDGWTSWYPVGKVLKPALSYNIDAFRASGYIENGVVAATASNAIHIKVGDSGVNPFSPVEKSGRTISILPKGTNLTEVDSRIVTNIIGGTLIFNEYSPFVGNKVYLEKGNTLVDLPDNFIPSLGDRIVILVQKPEVMPTELFFENHIDGNVYACYENGWKEVIAKVSRPVKGIGRFGGTIFSLPSRVRANHPGVIDISTCPVYRGSPSQATPEDSGGFQIIPIRHSYTSEMKGAWTATQWMIISPVDNDSYLEAMPPLFRGYIRPGYRVEARFKDNLWRSLPEGKGINNTFLSDLVEFRIIIPPLYVFPPPDVISPPVIKDIHISLENNTLDLSGNAMPGVQVYVFIDGIQSGVGDAYSDGFFVVKDIPIHRGEVDIVTKVVDPAGRESSFSQSQVITIPIEEVKPYKRGIRQ
ncbi:MAG: hypothetical protein ACP5PC_06410 [bacterium]